MIFRYFIAVMIGLGVGVAFAQTSPCDTELVVVRSSRDNLEKTLARYITRVQELEKQVKEQAK